MNIKIFNRFEKYMFYSLASKEFKKNPTYYNYRCWLIIEKFFYQKKFFTFNQVKYLAYKFKRKMNFKKVRLINKELTIKLIQFIHYLNTNNTNENPFLISKLTNALHNYTGYSNINIIANPLSKIRKSPLDNCYIVYKQFLDYYTNLLKSVKNPKLLEEFKKNILLIL